ncbi:MAG: 4Fe-4S dicluster domain-containing protein [Alphaproteobacteria bacterium]|nr:4Fe-4S dicluster domain-containing protein [Alphaproteobacteria bacterium]MBF0372200.1 4Fe-4S dicluster domain-containing protein [Alphaproteobacteria bacterium]
MPHPRQIAFVIDLNKCIGCQACTVACKRLWTSENGQELMYWCNVETAPGDGYPRNWAERGGGYRDGRLAKGRAPAAADYGVPFRFDYEARLFEGRRQRVRPTPAGSWSANWDEDQGRGDYPNAYFFYLPRLCNHCSRPACAEACPKDAIVKRPEDGLVVVNPDRCSGDGACLAACPYGKVFLDPLTRIAGKCMGCFPRLEQGQAPACVASCTGRAMHVAMLDDKAASVHRLVFEWRVALPLRPDFGTVPNVFYIPPFLGPLEETADGGEGAVPKIPESHLVEIFGPAVRPALATLRAEMATRQQGRPSDLMDLLIAHRAVDLLGRMV